MEESQVRVYRLPEEVFDEFVKSLDEVRETPKLDALLVKPSPFTDCE
jgi:hypothetical protein